MIYDIYSDGKRCFIASDEQLAVCGWKEGEYVSVDVSIQADSWLAAHADYTGEDMSPLDYWIELHGNADGFFTQGEAA